MSDAPPLLAILAPLKQWGGIERNLVDLCREFVARGVGVEFLLTRGGQVPYPHEFPPEVRIVDLQTRGKLDAVPRFIRYLRASRPQAVLTAKDHAAKVAVLARILARHDVRVVVKVTNTLSQTLRRGGKRRAAKWLYPYADRIIAISEGVRDDLISKFHFPPEKIRLIYNPVVTPALLRRSAIAVDHPWFRPGAQVPVILGAGRLSASKDFATLLEAFAIVRREHPARLVILGEGPERRALESKVAALDIAGDVLLPGYVQDPIPWMAGASLFVLSSRYEGLGNVLIEAMAVGTPLVATDCPSGPAEILEGGRHGALVPVGDPCALARAIRDTLDAPPNGAALREAAQRFRSDRIAEEYLDVLGLHPRGAPRDA